VLDDDHCPVAHIESYLIDFWACGNSEASCRSYAFDLLRWHRHLRLEQVAWDRATRDTVRDFVLSCRQPSALAPRVLSARTINHNLAVVGGFYAFHIAHQRGPLINPVPERRATHHRGHDADAGQERSFQGDRRADLRQRVPNSLPRALREQQVTDLVGLLRHPRDRALVEFYLSSAARPSELLGLQFEDVDAGQQLIIVTRKGTRSRQAIPASSAAFIWLRLYQDTLPADAQVPGSPIWWTLRRPLRPLTYDAARAILRRLDDELGSHIRLHDLRHTAAALMARDQSLSLPDVQRVLGHANLSTTQHYVRQQDVDLLARIAEHLSERSKPMAPPETPKLRYESADLTELLGDGQW
jgi:integrase/recombinase XerD